MAYFGVIFFANMGGGGCQNCFIGVSLRRASRARGRGGSKHCQGFSRFGLAHPDLSFFVSDFKAIS